MNRLLRANSVVLTCVLLAVPVVACRSTTQEATPPPSPSKDAGQPASRTAKSADEIRTWPLGIPQQFVLYDLGTASGSAPEAIHVDGDWLYWSQTSRLFRAKKDGSGTPERFGDYPGSNLGEHIATDDAYVYWISHDKLLRRAEAGGDVQTTALDSDYQGGAIATGGGYVYLASWGCGTINRFAADSLEREVKKLDVGEPRAGNTKLVIDGDALYCGAWNAVYALASWEAEPQRLVDSATRVEGVVVAGGNLYWLDNRGTQPSTIGRVPLAGGQATTFALNSSIASAALTLDRTHGRLFYLQGSWLIAFAMQSQRYSWFAKDSFVRQLAIDDKFIYYPQHQQYGGPSKPEHGAIVRLPLDYAPVLMVDPAEMTAL